MDFELRDHTADVAVEATGDTLGGTFAAAADGMAAATCDDVPAAGDRLGFAVEAESREALLFDYLEELIYVRDVEHVLPVDNDATVERVGERWRIDATCRGVPIDAVDGREVKAVTYSEMAIDRTDDAWRAHVVLDV